MKRQEFYGGSRGDGVRDGLEGFRRLNTFKAHPDKRQLEALLNRNGFSGLSELGEAPRSTPSTPHAKFRSPPSAADFAKFLYALNGRLVQIAAA